MFSRLEVIPSAGRLVAISTAGLILTYGEGLIATSEPLEVEKCGLSALKLLDFQCPSTSCYALVGSESGWISLLQWRREDAFDLVNAFSTHDSTVTEVETPQLPNECPEFVTVLSVGLDCRLVVSRWGLAGTEVVTLQTITLNVAFPQCILVAATGNVQEGGGSESDSKMGDSNIECLVAGCGLESVVIHVH